MTKKVLYKIASYVLLLVAGLFSMVVVFTLPIGLANPPFLLGIFSILGVVLYSFSSFQFLSKGLNNGHVFRKGFKDFIKVNAYVSLFFFLQSFISSLNIIINREVWNKIIPEMQQFQSGMTANLSPQELIRLNEQLKLFMQVGAWMILAYSVLLLVHVLATLRLLKKRQNLFLP
jgi:hypothetical protein